MGWAVTAASRSGGSGSATRMPGGRAERPTGVRVQAMPGLGGIAPVFVSEGDSQLTYMIPIALTSEFAFEAVGAR